MLPPVAISCSPCQAATLYLISSCPSIHHPLTLARSYPITLASQPSCTRCRDKRRDGSLSFRFVSSHYSIIHAYGHFTSSFTRFRQHAHHVYPAASILPAATGCKTLQSQHFSLAWPLFWPICQDKTKRVPLATFEQQQQKHQQRRLVPT